MLYIIYYRIHVYIYRNREMKEIISTFGVIRHDNDVTQSAARRQFILAHVLPAIKQKLVGLLLMIIHNHPSLSTGEKLWENKN